MSNADGKIDISVGKFILMGKSARRLLGRKMRRKNYVKILLYKIDLCDVA
jgi:hypothetical protein